MNLILDYFRPFPTTAKNGILFLIAGWIVFLASVYTVYLPGVDSWRIMVIGAASCFVVIRGYNWGRILCMLANIIVCLYCVGFALLFVGRNPTAFAASVVNTVLFSASTYYLWVRDSAEFFRTFRKTDIDGATPPGR